MTIEDLINDLNGVLERIVTQRGDKSKTIYDLEGAFRCGCCEGAEGMILYVLEKLKEMSREETINDH